MRPLSSSSGAPRVEGPAARRAPRAARRAPLLCCLLSVVSFSLGRVVQVEDPEFNRFKVHVTDLHAGEVDIDLREASLDGDAACAAATSETGATG